MKRLYTKKRFNRSSQIVIAQAEEICVEYAARGYELTLRQLYYQFVARDLLSNSDKSYKRLGSIVNDARLAGKIDWDHVVDRTRNIRGGQRELSADTLINDAYRYVQLDQWSNQPTRIEVWVEKDALIGIIESVAQTWGVQCFSCRGYTSQSEVWGAAQRLRQYMMAGQNVVILHLGDHDPSGIDMSRDIEQRLDLFLTVDWLHEYYSHFDKPYSSVKIKKHMEDWCGTPPLELRRIALNMDQVEEYQPPPNPAKVTDSRFQMYQDMFGDESWELDALDPGVLDNLISVNIGGIRDDALWEETEDQLREERRVLRLLADEWPDLKRSYQEEDRG